jgi:hypothetical protein
MSTGRRSFLRGLAALTAGGASLGTRLLQGQGRATSEQWDVSWRDRLTGKFRAVFDSPDFNGGDAVWRAATWKSEVAEVFGPSPDDMQAVVVIRHKAISMIMDDEFWAAHELGKKYSINDPATKAPSLRNTFRVAASGGGNGPQNAAPGRASSGAIDDFLKAGGIVLACGLAFQRMVSLERETDPAASRDEQRARAVRHVIPGVILQPSGFFAVLEAQRAGCGFFPQTSGDD